MAERKGAEAILSRLPQSTIRLGLERITAACDALGRPQGAFPSIHVAGTNGKGSTCAFLAASLTASGKKVGLYTSPHLTSFRERIRIDGVPISAEELDRSMARLLAAWPALEDPSDPRCLTYFEAATVLAFDAFSRLGVDVAVLEVGLGGRLDATNVPGKDVLATVISRIAIDHSELLGATLEGIAKEKGGIAQPGVPLVIGMQAPTARRVLMEIGEAVGAEVVDVETAAQLSQGEGGLRYLGEGGSVGGLRLGLVGPHQTENARLALATLQRLGVQADAWREGLAAARCPGRMQVVSDSPLVVLDGAHNPAGAAALAAAFHAQWPERRPRLVFGAVAEKDRRQMMAVLAPLAREVHLCPSPSDRAVPADALGREAAGIFEASMLHDSVEDALDAALALEGEEGEVLVCGSLFLVGAALSYFELSGA